MTNDIALEAALRDRRSRIRGDAIEALADIQDALLEANPAVDLGPAFKALDTCVRRARLD